MPRKPKTAPATTHLLALPEALNVETVGSVMRGLQAVPAEACHPLTLDASATESFTSAGAQLLLSLDATLKATGGELRLVNAKPILTESFRLLGLAPYSAGWEGVTH